MNYIIIYWNVEMDRWNISGEYLFFGNDLNQAHIQLSKAQVGRPDLIYMVAEDGNSYKTLPPPPQDVLNTLPIRKPKGY